MKPIVLGLFTFLLVLAGCIQPVQDEDGSNDDGDPSDGSQGDADWDGSLVLYMTSSTHSGRQGAHLAPVPGALSHAPTTCRVDVGDEDVQGLGCTIGSGTSLDYGCDGKERKEAPWTVRVHWNGTLEDRQGWTATAYDEAGRETGVWVGEELSCAGHLTE